MIINKTADETLIESGTLLLRCFTDPKLSIAEKQQYTYWVNWFLDYQDAVSNNKERKMIFLEQKLNFIALPIYYKNALQEFKNCNLFYNQINDFNYLKLLFLNYSTKATIKNITKFSNIFINTFKKFKIKLTEKFIENFQTLIYTIHYHLSYLFKDSLLTTVKTLISILTKKVTIKKSNNKIYLINIILKENEEFFNKLQQIQLINFIFQLEEIFETTKQNNILSLRINQVIFNKPSKINISMNALLKKNNIKLFDEIWKNNLIDEKKSKLLMHFFAYETYFLQGHNHHQIYENLVLKKIIDEDKYWTILHQYKRKNEIIS